MGFRFSIKPKRIILELAELPDDDKELFRKFNILCVVNEQRREAAYTDLIRDYVTQHADTFEDQNWVDWDTLETIMLENKFTVNRTTFWSYRKQHKFDGLVKSDGVTTLFEANAILAIFRGERDKG